MLYSLFCVSRTKSMLGSCGCTTRLTCSCEFSAPSDTIIFHAHGGGFVSQTSRSHLDYLHQWSRQLEVPILSVDYSVAPEAAYPRALEEVFYSYCWMINNFHRCGTTGKTIIVAGRYIYSIKSLYPDSDNLSLNVY